MGYLITLIISMIPIIELRGAIPVRSAYISFELCRGFFY